MRVPWLTCLEEEGVDNVRGVVDAESDGDDQVDTGNDVNGEAPEMHESAHINLAKLALR